MGIFKKTSAVVGWSMGLPVRPSTKKERHNKQVKRLLQQQNALLGAPQYRPAESVRDFPRAFRDAWRDR